MTLVPKDRDVGSWSDSELITACLDKSQSAWAELIRRYSTLVESIAARRGLSEIDVSDLNQLVWTQVYLKIGSVRDGDAFRSWLTTLTKNTCYHFGRKRRRIHSRETDRYELSEVEARNPIEPYDPLGAEAQCRLRAAIAELPPRCRLLVEQLYFIQPKPTYRAIAERLGVAEGSVGALRDRCLKRLFARLADDLAA